MKNDVISDKNVTISLQNKRKKYINNTYRNISDFDTCVIKDTFMNFTGSNEILKIWQTRRSTFETLNLNISVNIFTRLSDSSVPHILCCVNSRVCPGCALYKLTISSNQVSIVYPLNINFICMCHLLYISPFFLRLYNDYDLC